MRTGLTTELDRHGFQNNERKVCTDLGESGPDALSMTLYVSPEIYHEIAKQSFLPQNSVFAGLLRRVLWARLGSVSSWTHISQVYA